MCIYFLKAQDEWIPIELQVMCEAMPPLTLQYIKLEFTIKLELKTAKIPSSLRFCGLSEESCAAVFEAYFLDAN